MEHMKNMEERLWDFIDGLSTADEKSEIKFCKPTLPGRKLILLKWICIHIPEAQPGRTLIRFSKNVMEEFRPQNSASHKNLCQ
jgi:hypothetical protein